MVAWVPDICCFLQKRTGCVNQIFNPLSGFWNDECCGVSISLLFFLAQYKKKSSARKPSKRISLQVEYGTVMIAVLLTVVAFVLTAFGLNYHNDNATNGYQLKRLQEVRSELQFQIETLEMEIADLGSLKENLEDLPEE